MIHNIDFCSTLSAQELCTLVLNSGMASEMEMLLAKRLEAQIDEHHQVRKDAEEADTKLSDAEERLEESEKMLGRVRDALRG